MTLQYADRIKQITTTPPGTSAFALASTPALFFAFSTFMSVGDTTYYEADDGGTNVEVGLGTYSAANTLTRTTIYKSSNSGSPCNFTNNVTVICTAPASRLALLTAAGIFGAVDGSALINLNAANVSSGVLAAARGGAGSITGIMKANGSGVVSAAVAGTDYPAITGGHTLSLNAPNSNSVATIPDGTNNLAAVVVSTSAPPSTGTPNTIYCRVT